MKPHRVVEARKLDVAVEQKLAVGDQRRVEKGEIGCIGEYRLMDVGAIGQARRWRLSQIDCVGGCGSRLA